MAVKIADPAWERRTSFQEAAELIETDISRALDYVGEMSKALPGDQDIKDLFNATAERYVMMNTSPHGPLATLDDVADAPVPDRKSMPAVSKLAAQKTRQSRRAFIALATLATAEVAYETSLLGRAARWLGKAFGAPQQTIDTVADAVSPSSAMAAKPMYTEAQAVADGYTMTAHKPLSFDDLNSIQGTETTLIHYARGNDQVVFKKLPNDKTHTVEFNIGGKRRLERDTDGDGLVNHVYHTEGYDSNPVQPAKFGFFRKNGRWMYKINVADHYARCPEVNDPSMPDGLRWWPLDIYAKGIESSVSSEVPGIKGAGEFRKVWENPGLQKSILDAFAMDGYDRQRVYNFLEKHKDSEHVSFYKEGFFVLKDQNEQKRYTIKLSPRAIKTLI